MSLSSVQCQGPRNALLIGDPLFSRTFSDTYVTSVLFLAAGMIWKRELDCPVLLCLNPSVTPRCSQERVCNRHLASESLHGPASARLSSPFLNHAHSPPVTQALQLHCLRVRPSFVLDMLRHPLFLGPSGHPLFL